MGKKKHENDDGNDNEFEGNETLDGGETTGDSEGGKHQKEMKDALKPLTTKAAELLAGRWKPTARALDLVFGRFLAAGGGEGASAQDMAEAFQLDSSVAVAHLLSINAVTIQSDYFTALDDLKSGRSSVHIGSNECASGDIYAYVSFDVNMIERLVGKDELAEAIRCLLLSLVEAEPSARQATMAAKTPPFFVGAALHGTPTNLCGAFEKPPAVQPGSDLSLAETGVAALDRYWKNLARYYAGDDRETFTPQADAAAVVCLSERLQELAPALSRYAVQSRKELVDRLTTAAVKSSSDQERIGGRFIDVWIIKNVPVACLNRDDMNQPKTAEYGGFTRLRISSQCFKRAWRLKLHERYLGAKARRSKIIPGEIIKRLGLDVQNPVVKLAVGAAFDIMVTGVDVIRKPLSMFSKPASEPPATSALVFLGDNEIAEMTETIRGVWTELSGVAQQTYDACDKVRQKIEAGETREWAEAKAAKKSKAKTKVPS